MFCFFPRDKDNNLQRSDRGIEDLPYLLAFSSLYPCLDRNMLPYIAVVRCNNFCRRNILKLDGYLGSLGFGIPIKLFENLSLSF